MYYTTKLVKKGGRIPLHLIEDGVSCVKCDESIEDAAFTLEDEVRASARIRFLDSSMWSDIVMPYIEETDYREICLIWLSKIKERKQKETADA